MKKVLAFNDFKIKLDEINQKYKEIIEKIRLLSKEYSKAKESNNEEEMEKIKELLYVTDLEAEEKLKELNEFFKNISIKSSSKN